MSQNPTADFQSVVQELLNEDQLFSLQERRDNSRQNFVRPIRLMFTDKPQTVLSGFTRNLSDTGIGLIHKFKTNTNDQAYITINRLWDDPTVIRCKAAWCNKCENGWYQSGWKILSIESSQA
ncbi:MAG: PilZ domain-containing protein [Pirellulaceae bacterium]|nr:PilZ domain-containing protein [Pirellulaceae bacterium]